MGEGAASLPLRSLIVLIPVSYSSSNIFALVMGINDYAVAGKLTGAVPDATSMFKYLKDRLAVPEERIKTLYDAGANRAAILAAFENLAANDAIKRGDPIVIYFAGHGDERNAPPDWTPGVRQIQCLLPQDVDTVVNGKMIPPIPDRTLGYLLHKIADAKGNNIVSARTVIT